MTMTGVRPALTGCARIQAIDMKLKVVVIPVSDVDRAKAFYTKLGWRLDADFASGADRVIQFTPDLLRETETRHGRYEPSAPKHHWSSWYAAYIVARERGETPDDAAKDAVRQTERTQQ